jgi:hypothetical protein
VKEIEKQGGFILDTCLPWNVTCEICDERGPGVDECISKFDWQAIKTARKG